MEHRWQAVVKDSLCAAVAATRVVDAVLAAEAVAPAAAALSGA
jgi:hypothetical protein